MGAQATIITSQDIVEVIAKHQCGWFSGNNVINAPTTEDRGVGWYSFIVNTVSAEVGFQTCIAIHAYSGKSYIGRRYAGTWYGWAPLATAEPPTEYDLPLASGVSIHSRADYSKTQDRIATINLGIVLSNELSAGKRKVIATIPVGFRPGKWLRIPARQANSAAQCSFEIGTNGEITLAATQILSANSAIYCGAICYVAAP